MYSKIVDFIHELYRTVETVPLHAPCLMGNEKKYLDECIDSTFVSSVGKFVDKFEEGIAKYTGAKKAVVCVSGTNALHMSMLLAGVRRDDEILTQALTFIATCNAISYIGAHPVFVDVDKETMGLSPRALREWLIKNAEIKVDNTDRPDKSLDFEFMPRRKYATFNKHTGRRIKACIPMHTFGCPAVIDQIADICNEYHIELIEDAAESIGSRYKGKHTGTFGLIGALSFNGNKTITTGGGGMMLFSDEKFGEYAKHITTQAKMPHRWAFVHDHVGYNYRMPNINAAIGCAQLEHIEEFVLNKRETNAKYEEFFKDMPDVRFFTEPENCRSNYWLNVLIMKDKTAQQDFLQYSNDHKVMTRPIWELMNRLEMFKKAETDGLVNTQWLAERVVNLPSSVRM